MNVMNAINRGPASLSLRILFILLCLGAPGSLFAGTITGTVADPSGALIPGVRIEIMGGELTEPIVLSADGAGRFSSPNLKPGTYMLRLTREGFESLVET
jgi:hypothetical protein